MLLRAVLDNIAHCCKILIPQQLFPGIRGGRGQRRREGGGGRGRGGEGGGVGIGERWRHLLLEPALGVQQNKENLCFVCDEWFQAYIFRIFLSLYLCDLNEICTREKVTETKECESLTKGKCPQTYVCKQMLVNFNYICRWAHLNVK